MQNLVASYKETKKCDTSQVQGRVIVSQHILVLNYNFPFCLQSKSGNVEAGQILKVSASFRNPKRALEWKSIATLTVPGVACSP